MVKPNKIVQDILFQPHNLLLINTINFEIYKNSVVLAREIDQVSFTCELLDAEQCSTEDL